MHSSSRELLSPRCAVVPIPDPTRSNSYAIDSPGSFELLPSFLHTIRKVKSPDEAPTQDDTPENTPFTFLICGNKCDLREERVITSQQGLAFARAAGGLFYECSAKERVNIDGQSSVQTVKSQYIFPDVESQHIVRSVKSIADDDDAHSRIRIVDSGRSQGEDPESRLDQAIPSN